MFLSVLHTSFNTPALNCPLCALGYSNFLHFIPILSVKWALCVEYSMSFGVCHYHRHWKGTCNLQKYNPFVPATFILTLHDFKWISYSFQNDKIACRMKEFESTLNSGLSILISVWIFQKSTVCILTSYILHR